MKYIKYLILVLIICFSFACSKNEETKEKTNAETNNPTEVLKNYLETITKEYNVKSGDIIELDKSFENIDVIYECSSKLVNVDGNKITILDVSSNEVINVKAKWNNYEETIKFNISPKAKLVVEDTDITVTMNEEFKINAKVENSDEKYELEYDNTAFDYNDGSFVAKKNGEYQIKVKFLEEEKVINVKVLNDINFTVENIELYVSEEKELPINVISSNGEDIVLSTKDYFVEINGNKIIGIEEGVAVVTVTIGNKSQNVEVNIKDLAIEILNTDLEIDYLETGKLEIVYPEFLNDELVYTISDETLIKIEDGILYPLRTGKTKIKVSLKENSNIYKSTMVTVTADPIKIMESFTREEILMKQNVQTFGSDTKIQSVKGSVSKYYFGNLNLTVDIVNYSSDKYIGMKATPELLKQLDETGLVRTGIKLEKLQYITYHDTGNNTPNAKALGNINYMKSSGNSRGRSWHYTVDDTGVWQTIPDDEVTWQGDSYGAYATSIGIETCVDYNCNLDVVWHRMGKLCGKLLAQYGLNMSSIKQHYEWSGKNCPQTLRMNGLYQYALDMIEAEWIFNLTIPGYTITFESLTPQYLDNTGQIIMNPTVDTMISYKIRITNAKGYDETIEKSVLLKPLH